MADDKGAAMHCLAGQLHLLSWQAPSAVIPGRPEGEPGIHRAAGMLGEMDSGFLLTRTRNDRVSYDAAACGCSTRSISNPSYPFVATSSQIRR